MNKMQSSEFKKWVISVSEKYVSSKTLLKDSKNDPPQEPYKSKYEAKEILSAILSDLEEHWEKKNDIFISTIWAILKYELGVIALETEEYSTGCDYLTECWEILKEFSTHTECCILVLNVLNQLGILWSGRGEPSKALIYLKEAEKIYNKYKENSTVCPCLLEDMFNAEIVCCDDWKPFEKTFTLTMYYLAQVYEHLNDSEKSAKYCHMTLKRQKESEEYEEKEWSVNCATLSQYYIQEKMFETGRHLLACSLSTLTNFEASIDNRVDDEDVWDDIHRSKAEVAWCWVKYCINLLFECQNASLHNKPPEQQDSFYQLAHEDDITQIEEKVPAFVSGFEEARQVFLFGQTQIKEAKLYYTLKDHANNHVQLIQDHSKLYKHLMYYEASLERQCKMQKRRIDMLENVLTKLNPQYYLAVCKQLRFELGETYYELIDLKLKIVNASREGMALSSVKKINCLIMNAISHFKGFIDSYKDPKSVLPEVFEDDVVRPVLIAHFYLGGLYFKLIESDIPKKLHNFSKSEENYKFIINYCERNPAHASYVDKELPVIKEMVELMPERVTEVTGTTMF